MALRAFLHRLLHLLVLGYTRSYYVELLSYPKMRGWALERLDELDREAVAV